ncbi:hypothetical protein D3C81_1854970 [compost metagenome]
MADPGQVGIGQRQRLQHLPRFCDHPRGIGRVRVLAAQAQVGAQGHGVEVGGDFIAFGHRQFLWGIGGEAVF